MSAATFPSVELADLTVTVLLRAVSLDLLRDVAELLEREQAACSAVNDLDGLDKSGTLLRAVWQEMAARGVTS